MLSTSLQACFLPEPHSPALGSMAWWGTDDVLLSAEIYGLPVGTPSHRRIVQPCDDGVRPISTPVRVAPLAQALPALAAIEPRPSVSASILAWRAAAIVALGDGDPRRLDAIAAAMPPSAHAVADDGETIWTARSTLAAFTRAVARTYLADATTPHRLMRAKTALVEPSGLTAELRPYQRHGVAWLTAVADDGAGGLLADDMGLGKTLQAIALITARSAVSDRPHLVVCPTSVIGTWVREIGRFAPGLSPLRHHGQGRATEPSALSGVVITSYQVMLRDIDMFAQIDWDTVILDEAQQIKNRRSQTAMAARKLPARVRIALTGTPMENRLDELWSIMDFATPGLLGTHRRFSARFAEPIERRGEERVAARLRSTIEPYLLRRLKSEVARDLPPKQESIVPCPLTAEQRRLYRRAVSEAFDAGFGDGFARHGRILRLLTQLKQICNHPAHFLGERGPLSRRSGKLDRVTSMLAETVAEGAPALVFTQFRAMGDLLRGHLASELDLPEIPFLHGGVSAPAREAMVDRFQGGDQPILLVSLKAGGTGLTLTAATTVVHYDRWWNPAVEDQATDRAHRIGQTSPVAVYKLVTEGTLEDRIDELLQRKRRLADAVVGTGEDWITALDDRRLRALVELSDLERE